jgi:hypothetical protein
MRNFRRHSGYATRMRSLDRPDSHAGTSSSDAGTAAGKRTRTEVLQRRSAGGAPAGDTAGAGAPAAGGSNALPGALQAQMNAAFDFDFSAVQVHQGPEAARLGAEAFTAGTDVHFAPGRYQPDSAAGQSLIGHELAHVVQQSEGRVAATTQFRGRAGNDDDGLEAEADRWGDAAAAGQVIDRVSGVHAPSGRRDRAAQADRHRRARGHLRWREGPRALQAVRGPGGEGPRRSDLRVGLDPRQAPPLPAQGQSR